MTQNKKYGFVLLNWNGKDNTLLCLSSLDAIEYDKSFDIVVIDNGSTDGSSSAIKSHIKNHIKRKVTFVELNSNRGFTGGHIEGLNHTDAEIVCLLNNDAVVAPNILNEADVMISTVGENFGAIGGRAYFWNKDQKAFDIWNEFFTYQKIDPVTATAQTIKGDPGESLAPKIVDNVSGACVFVNRAVVTKAGYLDETFFAYYEETDMFARFKRHGHEIYYCPTIRYWHRFDPSAGSHGASSKHIKNFSTKLILRNQFSFAFKNFERKYLFKFLIWYFTRFFVSLIKVLFKPNRRDISKIIIETTLENIKKLPHIFKSRREVQQSLHGKPGYNSIIIKHAQRKTVVFVATPPAHIVNYIESKVEEDLRVHLRDQKNCSFNFIHRCIRLNTQKKHINALSAASARTESIVVITGSGVGLTALRQEIERSNPINIPYKKSGKDLYSFNRAFLNQISSENLALNEKINWNQKPRKHTVLDLFKAKTLRSRQALSLLNLYMAFRLRTGGIQGLARAVLGLVKNCAFNRHKALAILRAGAHEQRMHIDKGSREVSNKLSSFPLSDIPVFINCRDRVESLTKTISAIEKAGLKNIYLIDNQSSYPPLLDYYNSTRHQVILLGENMGHKAPWESLAVKLISGGNPYVVTDPDVVLSEKYTPSTIKDILNLFDEYPGYVKIGPGLDIDDLPDTYEHKATVQKWEKQFWEFPLKTAGSLSVFDAEIDTTFAIYRPNLGYITLPSIRLGGSHTAKHLPWYQNTQRPSEEELYYREHASSAVNTWNKDSLPTYLQEYAN